MWSDFGRAHGRNRVGVEAEQAVRVVLKNQ